MVSVSGTIEYYTGVGKNVGIETNPYIIMTSSTYAFEEFHSIYFLILKNQQHLHYQTEFSLCKVK